MDIPEDKAEAMMKRYLAMKGADGKLEPHAKDMIRKLNYISNTKNK